MCKNKLSGYPFLVLIVIAFLAGSQKVTGQSIKINANSAVDYILSRQKSNGAFGPVNMEYTDVAWTYPAVYTLKLLGKEIPNPDSCYINGGKPFMEIEGWKNGPWYWSLHQKANLYKLFDQSGALEENFPEGIKLPLQFKSRRTYLEPRKYAEGEFFDMASLWNVVEAVHIMNGKVENPEEIRGYIVKRQAQNGGFDDMLGNRAEPIDTFTHLIITHDAVMILNTLGFEIPEKQKLVSWIKSCQSQEGGFRWSPDHTSYSNKPDIWYTWAAIKTLSVLGERPKDEKACLEWINSLQNADGGFGDRPGWNSRLYSTYYAVHAVEMLTGNTKKGITRKTIKAEKQTIPEGVYSVFQAQHKTPSGVPGMVDTLAALNFNLVGVKTLEREVISEGGISEVVKNAREYCKEKGYKLEIVDCPENYRHRLQWFSGMSGDHCSNMLVPPEMSDREKNTYLSLYNEGLQRHPWQEFKETVIQPALTLGTLFYPELDFTMMNAYMVYNIEGKPAFFEMYNINIDQGEKINLVENEPERFEELKLI